MVKKIDDKYYIDYDKLIDFLKRLCENAQMISESAQYRYIQTIS